MRESNFNSDVVKSLREVGVWAYKIPDSPTSWTMRMTRFTPTKPCDTIACTQSGAFVGIEGKMFKKWQGFYKSCLRSNQIEALDEFAHKRKGKAYVFLNIRIKEERLNYCVVFDWKKYRTQILSKGFPVKVMRAREAGVWIKSYKGLYDLSEIF